MRGSTLVATLALGAALSSPIPALAADQTGSDLTLMLSQQATKTIPPDRIRVEMKIEAVGEDPRRLQADVNRRMAAALATAKTNPSVTAETGAYSVYPEGSGEHPRWHVIASFALNSADFGAAMALAGDLQATGCLMSSMQFSLAPETLAAAADGLTATALAELRKRAAAVAKDLGTTVDRFQTITIGPVGEPFLPRRMFAAAALSASAAPPVAEPADATVSLTINADIMLAQPRK
jgi:predicted secreted protein